MNKKRATVVALVILALAALGFLVWAVNHHETTKESKEEVIATVTPAAAPHENIFFTAVAEAEVVCNDNVIKVRAEATSKISFEDAYRKALSEVNSKVEAEVKCIPAVPSESESTPASTPEPPTPTPPTPPPLTPPPPTPTPSTPPPPTPPPPTPPSTPTPTPQPQTPPPPTPPPPTPTPIKSVIFEPIPSSGPAPLTMAFRIIVEGGVVDHYQISCDGGRQQGEQCIYNSAGTYHPRITVYFTDGDIVSGNAQVVVY